MWEHKDKYELKSVLSFCRQYVKPGVKFDFEPGWPIGKGNTQPVGEDKGSKVGIGKGRGSLRKLTKREAAIICVTAGHELRHLQQLGLAVLFMEEESMAISTDVCASSAAYRHNRRQYALLGQKQCLFETDAEMGSYVYGGQMLAGLLSGTPEEVTTEVNKLLVDLFNESVASGSYYLRREDCAKFPAEDMKDVAAAFKKAVERTKDTQKPWPNRNDQPCGDEFLDAMRRGRTESEDYWKKFVSVNKDGPGCGTALVRAMASLSLYLHEDEAGEYPVDLSDLSPEKVFGSAFPDSPKALNQYVKYVREKGVTVINRGGLLKIPEDYGTDKAKAKHDKIVKEAMSRLGSSGTGIDTTKGKDSDDYARG